MQKYLVFAALPALFLSACSESSDTPTYRSYDSYIDEFGDFVTDPAVRDLQVTPTTRLPFSTEARYNGVALVETDDLSALAGAFTLTTNFDNDRFSGRISEIRNDRNQRYSGSVGIAGDIDRFADPVSDFQLLGELDGRISNSEHGTFDITGFADGDLYGRNREAVVLDLYGVADGVGSNDFSFSGGAVGTR